MSDLDLSEVRETVNQSCDVAVATDPKAILPTIKITWDPNIQMVDLSFDPKEFKNWHFIVKCIEEALERAKMTRDALIGQGLQRMQMEQMAAQQLAAQLQQKPNGLRRR